MAIVNENKLKTPRQFNKEVTGWTRKVQGISVHILQRTFASGKLRNELKARFLKDREGGPAYIGLGFRFWKYGVYREYGAGRGYIVKDGIIMRGRSEWYDRKTREKWLRRGLSEYRIRRMRKFDDWERYSTIYRTPLPWLDPPITDNINELADISGEYYGDLALKKVLDSFTTITITSVKGKDNTKDARKLNHAMRYGKE